MNRPRESILNLFDPLNSTDPSTPKRERDELTRSPDSDKENSSPAERHMGEMTAFFHRTYARKAAESKPPIRTKPMKRLVDVGEMTVMLDDVVGLGIVTEEDEGEEAMSKISLDEFEVESTPRHQSVVFPDDSETPMQRAPFVDITPEATPVAPKRTYRREDSDAHADGSGSAVKISHSITRAPAGSPLASIINAINFAEEESASHPSRDQEIPQISISSPSKWEEHKFLASSTSHLVPSSSSALLTRTTHADSLACSTAQLIPSATSALLTHVPLSDSICRPLSPPGNSSPPTTNTRPRSQTTPAPNKPAIQTTPETIKLDHRHKHGASVDLHASFNFQIQNPDSSFDLINDRISFFDSSMGMESSMIGREMSMNMDTSMEVGEDTIGTFDVKDEEARMRTFLGMSAAWGGGSSTSSEKLSHAQGDVTFSRSVNSTPKPAPKATKKESTSSTESTPKAPAKTAKKRLSSPLPSVPILTSTSKDASPTPSPPKVKSTSIKPSTICRSSDKAATPSPPKPERTPAQSGYVAPPPVPALRIIKRAVVPTSSSAVSRPSISTTRPPIPPIPAEKPAHKPTLSGVQRPRPSKAATVAAPPKNIGFSSRMAKVPAGSKAVADSRLSKPASVIGTQLSRQVQSKLPAPSIAPRGIRQPSRFGYAGKATEATPSGITGGVFSKPTVTASSRLPAPGVKPVGRVGSSIPAVSGSRLAARRA